MFEKPDLLLACPMNATINEGVAATFTVHHLWEGDRTALLARLSSSCRFVATSSAAKIDGAFMDQLPKLEVIANFGVGYDSVDTAAAAARGIVVTNTPDVLTEEVADVAMGLLIAIARELPASERYLRAGKWPSAPFPLTKGTLRGRTLGILGYGRIGQAIARRAAAFGLEIAYHARSKKADVPYPYYETPLALALAVDTLMVIAPATPQTKNLVDAKILEALGPNGILINMARGSLVDEPALIEALRTRTILGAGLDVFADEPNVPPELIALDNAVLLPHVGSGSEHTRAAMGQLVVDNLLGWKNGKVPLTPVPETPWPR